MNNNTKEKTKSKMSTYPEIKLGYFLDHSLKKYRQKELEMDETLRGAVQHYLYIAC